jgi:ABC-2 type transport system permease protein
MNKFLLFLILLPKGLWKALGADVNHLRAILKVKLMLDDRRPLTMGRQQAKKKPTRYMTALSVFLSAVIGFMYVMPLMLEDIFMGLWLYFSVFLLMLSFMLISDFSTVLFDTRDKTIILPRPINERTLLLSRLLHMFIYLFRIVVPMSLGGWITLGAIKGWTAAIWFPFAVLMLTIVALFLVNACYLLVLRFSKPNKFKDIINYFQIFSSVLFFACVYLMPRAADSQGFKQLIHSDYPWAKFTPTYWIAASWSWIQNDPLWSATKWLSILAIVGPMILVWLTVKYLSPSFAKRIGSIDTVSSEAPPIQSVQKIKSSLSNPLYLRLANLLNKNPLGKAGFCIAWLQTGRSRNFKMRVYPVFAFVPVYFFYLITLNRSKSISETWENLSTTKTHILLLYMTSFVVMNLLAMLVHTDQYKSSWIYYSSPIEKPGSVMNGAFKGVWIKYFVPMYALVSCFVLYTWGWSSIVVCLFLQWKK